VKRSKSVRLVLIGLSAGALASCGQKQSQPISPNDVYTNNHYVPGVGYYHAPFRAWYAHPYNYFDSGAQRYFYGGQWGTLPHVSITNISPPTQQAVQQTQAQRTDVRRGGFGSTSHHRSTWS
jgi:hypothetical protein